MLFRSEGPRPGTEYSKLRLLDGVHRTASTIADFVNFDDFILLYGDSKGKKKVDDGKGGADVASYSSQTAKTEE